MTGSGIPSHLMAELRQAAERAAKVVRDPEAMRQACERMDRISEQLRKRHGVLDIGTPAIRELREAE
ncbi:MAG TPA: hypothetical protein VKA46_31155 [Gemmataceae bacterium]|nr:hypothetical protein [Gemmataceae bacterium]